MLIILYLFKNAILYLDLKSMTTSCNTHDYDGKLREKWFQMRPMLLEKYLPNCLSFDDTLNEIEKWLDKKYYNVKRIGRARRSLRILTTHRRGNFDSRNDIDVEELLPILWNQVKNQVDIHDTFYEQLCDITGGSCSQGRSTRLFQFLFLFDLPSDISTTTTSSTDISTDQESIKKDLTETTLVQNSISVPEKDQQSHVEEKQQLEEESNPSQEQQSHVEEKQQLKEESNPPQEQQSHVEEKIENHQESNDVEQINSSSNKIE
jgi:hypothetical protein